MTIKKALIVEDDRALFELIKAYLEDQGIEAINAGSAKSAMEILAKNDFWLATVDNGLPDIEGHKLIKQIRRMKPDIKIIMLTGTQNDELERKSKENGADVFMVKDIGMHFLSDIESICKKN